MPSWRERVIEAMERGRFLEEDKQLVCMWTTCKVGEEAAKYPGVVLTLLRDHVPADRMLYRLGGAELGGFSRAVEEDRPEDADAILDAIEERVMELKREVGTTA